MITLKQAYEIAFSQSLNRTTQQIKSFEALNKILAQDLYCERNLPAFSNSAMDGYVVSEIAQSYKITHTILAGDTPPHLIPKEECFKIMTGAKVPSNALLVIPFENTKLQGDCIEPIKELKPHSNIKFEGEECKKGEILLKRGEKLTYANLSLVASQGIDRFEVFSPLNIAIYSSGNEVVELGESAKEEQIYNINALSYHSLLSSYGFNPHYQGILSDQLETIEEEIDKFKNFDVVFTSGGASVGEADFFEKALLAKGAEILFHGINLKPGRPMLMARLKNTIIFSLPGNPLSGLLNLITIALPSLFALQGANSFFPYSLKAKNKSSFKLKNGRSNMILGSFDGEYFKAYKDGKYGSGAILPIKESNAIAIFDERFENIKENEEIKILLLPFTFEGEKFQWINF